MSDSALRRHWPIIVSILATAVIAIQVSRYIRHRGADGENPTKDPKGVANTWSGLSGTGPKIAKGWVGWMIADTADKQGVIVVDVYEGGPAFAEGIRKGDTIVQVNGNNATQEKILEIINTHSPGYVLDLEVRHEDMSNEFLSVTIGTKSGIDSLCMRNIAVASSGIAALQLPDGLWPHYLPNPEHKEELRSSVATSALACAALALAGKDGGEDAQAAYAKGLPVLLRMIAKDGGLDDPRDAMPHRVYANSFLLLALAQEPDKYPAELASVRSWLARAQIGGEDWEWVDPLDNRHGGWSYHAQTASTGKALRADVSVTSWALDALAASGLPADRVEWSRAARYLERCQNREFHSKDRAQAELEKPYRDGGFSFTPRYSKAGREVLGAELEVYRSYGSATADGLRGLLAVSVDDFDKDSREAALQWLARNYTLGRNPGFGDKDMSGWSNGVYFYWLASLARALHAAKIDKVVRGTADAPEPHSWPDELARLLANYTTFYKKHVFASPNDQMHEDSPTTSTAFAVIALCAARDRVRAGNGRVLVAQPVAAPPPERETWNAPDLTLVEKGQLLFQSGKVGCTGCHSDKDATNGPPLMGVADRFLEWHRTQEAARAYLKKHIRNAKEFPGTQADKYHALGREMNTYDPVATGLDDDMLEAIVEFLLSREGNLPVSEAR